MSDEAAPEAVPLPGELSVDDGLRWENWDLRVDKARADVERAQRGEQDAQLGRSMFQQSIFAKYKIDPAKDKIQTDRKIVRG